MQLQQAIKLLKEGKAQLFIDSNDEKIANHFIMTEVWNFEFVKNKYLFGIFENSKLMHKPYENTPIINLSDIVEEKCSCEIYDNNPNLIMICDNCHERQIREHVCDIDCNSGGFCIKRHNENVKIIASQCRLLLKNKPLAKNKEIMNIKGDTVRTTKVTLNQTEFVDAIRMYLKEKGVRDTEHHVVINPIHTRSDHGIICEVEIKNYNKDKNIHD